MTLKIVTWNINSVRLRIDIVLRFLREEEPDILCLQETKTVDDSFPRAALAEFGYTHQAVRGQVGYHGVAILSRRPFREEWSDRFCDTGHARHIAVTLSNGIELHNFYVPAGGDIPDPDENPKFAHKLSFIETMERHFARMKDKGSAQRILVGDLNVAPQEHDVWSHKQLLTVVSHTPVEVERLMALKAAHDFIDVTRHFVPETEKAYTWWSYRARDWAMSDRGRRLDHIWLSPGLKAALAASSIHKPTRSWPQPSDHVPVSAILDI